MYYSPGQGQITPGEQNFDANRKVFFYFIHFYEFQKISLNCDFISIF